MMLNNAHTFKLTSQEFFLPFYCIAKRRKTFCLKLKITEIASSKGFNLSRAFAIKCLDMIIRYFLPLETRVEATRK